MPRRQTVCKHRALDSSLRCKTCGDKVDISQKRNKYGAKRKDGFDSTKEQRRFQYLVNDPTVFSLQCQKEYALEVNGELICKYRADFVYLRSGDDKVWREVVEDAKPKGKEFRKAAAYQMFLIKKKLMKACHKIDIVEV